MNVFEKLISEFSSMTGLELAPDRNDSCSLESNGIYIMLQYRSISAEIGWVQRDFTSRVALQPVLPRHV